MVHPSKWKAFIVVKETQHIKYFVFIIIEKKKTDKL